jgi:hypothetical protein|tara:strand:+ start:484 stop:1170 length:687 start_codon:yes stop_codon:yes gene_type:complete
MARISTYSLDNNVQKNDLLLGSDQGAATKNFQLLDVAKSMTKFNMTGQPQIGYIYNKTTKIPGSITITNGADDVAFSSLTSIIVSKFNYGSTDSSQDLLLSMVGSEVTISSIDNANHFGRYTLDSATVLPSDNNYYTLSLFHKGGNGNITKDQFYILSSKRGDKSFVYTQAIGNPQSVWSITHNLGKKPSVTIATSTNNVVVGEVTYVNDNQLTITLSSANSGKAYLN